MRTCNIDLDKITGLNNCTALSKNGLTWMKNKSLRGKYFCDLKIFVSITFKNCQKIRFDFV